MITWGRLLTFALVAASSVESARAAGPGCGGDDLRDFMRLDRVVDEIKPGLEGQRSIEAMANATAKQHAEGLAADLEAAVKGPGCVRDPQACLVEKTAEVLDSRSQRVRRFMHDMFTTQCLRGGRLGGQAVTAATAAVNREALALQMVVGVTSLGATFVARRRADADSEFPFAILATSILSTVLRQEIACQNSARATGTGGGPPLSWGRQALRNYAAYQLWVVPMTAVYVGFLFTEDVARFYLADPEDRESPFTREKLEELLIEGGLSMVWDSVVNGAHVLIVDRVLLQNIPDKRKLLDELLRRRVFSGRLRGFGDKKFLIVKGAEWPGLLGDLGIRTAYSGVRSYLYLWASDALKGDDEGAAPEELPQP